MKLGVQSSVQPNWSYSESSKKRIERGVGVEPECNWRETEADAEWRIEEGRGERRAFVARTSYSGQEVVSRPRNGEEGEERRNEGRKEGRKGGTLAAAAAAAAAPVIFLDAAPICASFLLLTDPVMPTRAGICSPKVYSPFQKTKKYSHSTCQLKGERNMYICEIYGRKTYNSYSGMDCTYYSTYSYSIG